MSQWYERAETGNLGVCLGGCLGVTPMLTVAIPRQKPMGARYGRHTRWRVGRSLEDADIELGWFNWNGWPHTCCESNSVKIRLQG